MFNVLVLTIQDYIRSVRRRSIWPGVRSYLVGRCWLCRNWDKNTRLYSPWMGITQLWSQQGCLHQLLASQWWDNFVFCLSKIKNLFKSFQIMRYKSIDNKNRIKITKNLIKVICSDNSKACIVFKVNMFNSHSRYTFYACSYLKAILITRLLLQHRQRFVLNTYLPSPMCIIQ